VSRKGHYSGERGSNAWVTCPQGRDNPGKLGLIPDKVLGRKPSGPKVRVPPGEGPASYQLVGGVMAYQGCDGYEA